jgi:hypothetical protein
MTKNLRLATNFEDCSSPGRIFDCITPLRGSYAGTGSQSRDFRPFDLLKEVRTVTHDEIETECPASAGGILDCLRMLAEEAASLHLDRTLAAIRDALATCEAEGSETLQSDPAVSRTPIIRTVH